MLLRGHVGPCRQRGTCAAAGLLAACRECGHAPWRRTRCGNALTCSIPAHGPLRASMRGILPEMLPGSTLQHVEYIAESMRTKKERRGMSVASRASENRKVDEQGEEGDEEPATVVDLTEDSNATAAKLAHKAARPAAAAPVYAQSCLSAQERHMLTRMLYDAVYSKKAKKGDEVDIALWYQAGLELRWLEEWAHDTIRKESDASTASKTTSSDACATKSGTAVADARRRRVKRAVLERADLHKPLSYIIGTQPFFGCEIHCERPLLCPRPETEMWVHWFVTSYLTQTQEVTQPLRVLDLCCGTGCIGVAVAKHVAQAEVLCVDLLECAVRVTLENAQRNHIVPATRLQALQSDMFDIFLEPGNGDGNGNDNNNDNTKSAGHAEGAPGRTVPRRTIAAAHRHSLDLLLCNPPYVLPEQYAQLPPDITLWESKVALVGDESRATRQYRYFQELCEYGVQMLKPRRARAPGLRAAPNICIEVGLQAELVASLMERSAWWDDVSLHLDLAQQPRWVTANSRH